VDGRGWRKAEREVVKENGEEERIQGRRKYLN
jgi:hypothetical protein